MRLYRNLKITQILYYRRNVNKYSTSADYVNHAQGGQSNFEKDYERTHVETTPFQKFLLGLGSGMVSITDPSRGDMIAAMGESTGTCAIEHMYSKMSQSEEGRAILEEKPRINSATVDLERLKSLPDGTLGKAYSNFLEKYKYTPDTRMAVRFVDDIEAAYVMQRYREVHDLFHTLLDMPTNMLGEVTVKWVEAIQTRLPMCVTGALFGSVRLAPKFTRMYSTKFSVTFEPALSEDLENNIKNIRKHSGLMTTPSVELPEKIQRIIYLILEGADKPKLVAGSAELLNHVDCKKPPHEARILKERQNNIILQLIAKEEKNVDELSELDREALRKKYEKKAFKIMHRGTYKWKQIEFDENLSRQYLISRASFEYAALVRIFNEIHKRDKKFSPTTLFDFGSGVGTVSWAAHKFWGESIKEYFTVDTSSAMNELAYLIIHQGNPDKPPILKTLYQREFLPVTPHKYDLVVSSFSFMEVGDTETRLKTFLTLWNKVNRYMVLVENGTNAGFRLLTEFREFLTHLSETSKTKFHVFAPCAHDFQCPRFYEETEKKTPCNFPVTYQIFKYLSHTGKGEDYEQKNFCYLVIKKGERPKSDPQWPRIVRPLLGKKNHIHCDLCTSQGKLEHVVFTKKKHGKLAYKIADYSNWGDLIPGEFVSLKEDKNQEDQRNEEIEDKEITCGDPENCEDSQWEIKENNEESTGNEGNNKKDKE